MSDSSDTSVTTLDAPVVDAYLDRIGHAPIAVPDLATLASLQDAHVRHVPFENLDIHLGRPLSLDPDALVAKVVHDRRGGFCFELNGLFAMLLTSLGFRARLVEARSLEPEGLGPPFDHARILVTVEQTMLLVDVGTGASPRGPLHLDPDPQSIGVTTFRVRREGARYVTERAEGDRWVPDWSFDTVARDLTDFAVRCRYHQESPDSHFTQQPICSLVTEEGQITLADRRLIITRDGRRREEEVADPLEVLAERFDVVIPRWPGTSLPGQDPSATSRTVVGRERGGKKT